MHAPGPGDQFLPPVAFAITRALRIREKSFCSGGPTGSTPPLRPPSPSRPLPSPPCRSGDGNCTKQPPQLTGWRNTTYRNFASFRKLEGSRGTALRRDPIRSSPPVRGRLTCFPVSPCFTGSEKTHRRTALSPWSSGPAWKLFCAIIWPAALLHLGPARQVSPQGPPSTLIGYFSQSLRDPPTGALPVMMAGRHQ